MVRVLCFAVVFALAAVCSAQMFDSPTFAYASTGSKLLDFILQGLSGIFDNIYFAIEAPILAVTTPIMATGATIYATVGEFLANVTDTADTLGAAVASLHNDVIAFAGTVMMQIWDALVATVIGA